MDTSPGELTQIGRRRSFASVKTIVALMLREMATTYGRSPGGYLWAALEPAAGITLLTLIFAVGFRAPPLGTNFAIFYATGIVPFLMYNTVSTAVMQSLNFSKQLLSYPTVTFVDAILGRFFLNTLTQLLVAYVVFSFILLTFDTRTTLELDLILQGFALTAALALGIGTANAFLVSMFPVWQGIWGIFTRPLFLVSCVFFLFDSIPEPYRSLLWYNPLVHIVGLIRAGFYTSYDAAYASPVYVLLVSLITFVGGLVFLQRYHRDILFA